MATTYRRSGFTRSEVGIALGVIAVMTILVGLSIPTITDGDGVHNISWQMVNNGRQLFLAAHLMAMDRDSAPENERSNFGWTGELAGQEGKGRIETVKQYVERLISWDYLKPADASRILGEHGQPLWDGAPGTFSGDKHCVFRIYRTTREDPDDGLFVATRNFVYGKGVDSSQPPLSGKNRDDFVVIRMLGDGAAYRAKQATKVQMIGRLPGRREWREGDVETPADSLLQR